MSSTETLLTVRFEHVFAELDTVARFVGCFHPSILNDVRFLTQFEQCVIATLDIHDVRQRETSLNTHRIGTVVIKDIMLLLVVQPC